MSAIQSELIEFYQRRDHFRDLGNIFPDGDAVNQIQGIIQKMGINLSLQSAKLCIFYSPSHLVTFVDHAFHSPAHRRKAVDNFPDFILPGMGQFDLKISSFHFFDLRIQKQETL